MEKKKKNIIIVAIIAVVVIALIIFAMYAFVPIGSFLDAGDDVESIEMYFFELKIASNPLEPKTVVLVGEECAEIENMLKGMKVYNKTFLAQEGEGRKCISFNIDRINIDGENASTAFLISEREVDRYYGKYAVINPLVTKEEYLKFFNKLFEYYYK